MSSFVLERGNRVLCISVHQDVYGMHSQRLFPYGKVLRAIQPSTVERSFAESKEFQGFRFARYRGVRKVTIQVLMTAISKNLKKWVNYRICLIKLKMLQKRK